MEDLREKKIDGEVEYEYEYERVVNPVFQQMNLNRCITQNMCFDIIFCTGSGRRTPAFENSYVSGNSSAVVKLKQNSERITFDNKIKMRPASPRALETSKSPELK
jgi:hypothetical protein